ncbi:MAG: diaminopimelate decarboxylase [Candidatus Hydrogenedentes bacterium]|nr:diaminopimelate decarboxylase [Candidatus Hydrogenedentota bacterium]
MGTMERLRFLTEDQVRTAQREYGTPVYVYDQATLESQARLAVTFPNAFGLTARFAMKALPSAAVIRVLTGAGLHIDASSGFEAARAMKAGVPAAHIQITAQQMPSNLADLLNQGVLFTACSLHQLATYGKLRPGGEACVRINPGLGSGHSNRTNTGGPSASFGIWNEHLDQVLEVAARHKLTITRMHTHIGSGSDPEVWHQCAQMALGIAARLPDVRTLSLGGGFKVGRMAGEVSTGLHEVGERIKRDFEAFHAAHGRKLHIEIEPGTFLVANAGALICTAIDVVDTGEGGYRFITVDSGMTEVVRPSMYGAQHPIVVVPATNDARGTGEYLVVGHCCESGDVLTPEPGSPEGLLPRTLTEARIGDAVVVGGSGAYCASMSSKNYNSFPEAPEVMLRTDGTLELIRKRQTLEQMTANEIV